MRGIAASSQKVRSFTNIPNNTERFWWKDASLRRNIFYCTGLLGTLFFNGFDGSLFGGLQSIPTWQDHFGHPTSNTLGIMNTAGFLPGVVISFVADYIGQLYGRRLPIWIGSVLAIAGGIITAFASDVGVFCGGRVLMGLGTAMALTTGPPLLQEFAHPRYRPQIGALYTCIYYIAAIASSGICLGTATIASNWAWRIPCLMQIVGPIFVLTVTCTMPESPRWLAKKGRIESAHRVLANFHANGCLDDPLVNWEVSEIKEALKQEEVNNQTRYRDFLKTSGNRRRLLIVVVVAFGINWSGNGIISYYLSPILNNLGIKSSKTQLKILIGIAVWNLFVSVAASQMVDILGRRFLFLTSTAGMLASMTIVTGLSAGYAVNHVKAAGTAVIPFLFIFYGFYDIAWTPLGFFYPVEVLPFSMRTKGQAMFMACGALANAVNTWVNPVALDSIHWKYYIVYIGILVGLFVVIYFFFPETRNLSIEEIATVFDGERAMNILVVGGTSADAKKPSVYNEKGEDATVHEEYLAG